MKDGIYSWEARFEVDIRYSVLEITSSWVDANGTELLNVSTSCLCCNSDISNTIFLQANQGDMLPADIICKAPETPAKAPSIQTVDINCHEKNDVTLVVYSKGNITARYWSSPEKELVFIMFGHLLYYRRTGLSISIIQK